MKLAALLIILALYPAVERWRPLVEAEISRAVSPLNTCTVLALIQVESSGNPYAHRSGSQFRGLLQMGPAAAEDVGVDHRALEGKPRLAIRALLRYFRIYLDLPIPGAAAACWKGGPAVCRNYLDADTTYLDRFYEAYRSCE